MQYLGLVRVFPESLMTKLIRELRMFGHSPYRLHHHPKALPKVKLYLFASRAAPGAESLCYHVDGRTQFSGV